MADRGAETHESFTLVLGCLHEATFLVPLEPWPGLHDGENWATL